MRCIAVAFLAMLVLVPVLAHLPPTAVRLCRRLVGKIITRFEQRGYKLTALKLKQADEALLKKHYK